MLEKQSLWATATRCHQALAAQGIPHAIIGGVAVCLHGYQRNTVDVDLLVRREESDAIRDCLEAAGFQWNDDSHEFRDENGVAVQCLLAGDRAGSGSEVRLPSPDDSASVQFMEGLPAVSLARLIESKIACGEGSLRRTHKDFADVVELIAVHQLHGGFAGQLHKSVRGTFRRLVKHAQGAG